MEQKTTRFLIVNLAIVSVLCIIVFTAQTLWNNARGAEAITDIGVIYMSGMSEQTATHFGTTIELRLSQVRALVDAAPPEWSQNSSAQVTLTYGARARGFEYLAFCTEDGEFDMIYGEKIRSGMPEAFFQSLSSGREQISAGWDETGTPVVMMGIPAAYVLKGGGTSVALVAGLPTSYLKETLDLNHSLVDFSIVRRDGSFILRSDAMEDWDNYFTRAASLYRSADGKPVRQFLTELQSAMDRRQDYASQIHMDGSRWNFYCTALPNSQWHLLLYMSYGTLDQTIDTLGRQWTFASLGGCSLILFCLLLVFLRYIHMSQRQIRDLNEARRSAERASQVKSEFLSNISHDIRTPMNGIMGMTAVAIANLDNTPHVRSCLKKINVSSQHLLGLINDMLDMSKIESGRLSLNAAPVSLQEILHNVTTIIQPHVQERNQRFHSYTQNILCETVLGDHVRLTQILLNLLNNAVKFTPEGGEIQMTLRQEASPKGENYVRTHFYVQDNGPGMAPEFQRKIFDPFIREDTARVQKAQGAGLGLTITKHILDAMQGAIEVDSVQDRGSCFHVTLDLEKPCTQEQEMRLPPRRVLLVEDDACIWTAAQEMLESIGLSARWAASGAQALELARQERPEMVLLDWSLPDRSCLPTVQELSGLLGDGVPILLLFEGDWGEVEVEARAAGVAACIAKPLFRSSLYYGLRRFAGEEASLPEPEEAPDFTGRRVLLAEDNDLNWEIANELLMDLGLEMERAEDGQICLDRFQQSPLGWYDAILMDLRMPNMTGFESACAIRALKREDAASIPIIAISADAFYDDIQRCLDCGMNAHTPKPIDIQELARLLDQFLPPRPPKSGGP